jgi:putative transposase
MPDHVHLFVATDDEKITPSKWVKSLKNTMSKTVRLGGVTSPHWQKTFFDHVLRSSESYSEKWGYVRENPVRGGLVKKAEEWPFMGEVFRLEYHSG